MQILCDVCEKLPATVICCADEAALCSSCDGHIHAANKFASKHQRLQLTAPSPERSAPCDICQEKTGYFFCLEDRAFLCRNCDFSIHSSNALTSNHRRFLVTGSRVSLHTIPAEDVQPVVSTPGLKQGAAKGKCVVPMSGSSRKPEKNVSRRAVTAMASSKTNSKGSQAFSAPLSPESSVLPVLSGKASPNSRRAVTAMASSNTNSKGSQGLSAPLSPESSVLPVSSGKASPNSRRAVTAMASSNKISKGSLDFSAPLLPESSVLPVFSGKASPNSRRAVTAMASSNTNSKGSLGFSAPLLPESSVLPVLSGKASPKDPKAAPFVMRKNTISEYLTDLEGWGTEEFLTIPDITSAYNLVEAGSSKADAPLWDLDWHGGLNLLEDQPFGDSFAEVPQMPCSPPVSGRWKCAKMCDSTKWKSRQEFVPVSGFDDSSVVPDLGYHSSPRLSPSPPKRRRTLTEL